MLFWSCLVYLALWIHRCLAFDIDYANLTAYTLGTTSVSPHDPFLALGARQQRTCPTGLLPCAGQNYCCQPSTRCCGIPATSCCTTAAFCDSSPFPCCPFTSETCGGRTCCIPGTSCCAASPVGCCPPGASCCATASNPCCPEGFTCCGDTCCPSGEICERSTCIPAALKNNIARFHYDEKKNGNLLRNMCNGLRGKNTGTYTYSGPANTSKLRRAKRKKRRDAGCKGGFCKKTLNNGGNSALNSCDEFPPASSDEGGGTLPALQRAVNCIEDVQNSFQGGVFSGILGKLAKGDKFVISVDCDEVLGAINPRETISSSGGRTRFFNSTFVPDGSSGLLVVPFGDLLAGSYTGSINVSSGSATGAFVVDSTGDNLTTHDAPLRRGQTQQFSFVLDDEAGGVGLLLATNDASTNVTWSLQGTTFDNVTDTDQDPEDPDNPQGASAPQSTDVPAIATGGASRARWPGWIWAGAGITGAAAILYC